MLTKAQFLQQIFSCGLFMQVMHEGLDVLDVIDVLDLSLSLLEHGVIVLPLLLLLLLLLLEHEQDDLLEHEQDDLLGQQQEDLLEQEQDFEHEQDDLHTHTQQQRLVVAHFAEYCNNFINTIIHLLNKLSNN